MPNDEEAAKAITALDGKELGGRELKLNEARPKVRRSGPRGSGRGRGGFSNEDYRESARQPREPAGSLKYGLCAIVSVHCNLKEIECHPHSKSARRK